MSLVSAPWSTTRRSAIRGRSRVRSLFDVLSSEGHVVSHVEIFEKVHAHQFEHFEPDTSQWAGKGMFPPVFFARRILPFHPLNLGHTFGTR
jgi:hypothetical protein